MSENIAWVIGVGIVVILAAVVYFTVTGDIVSISAVKDGSLNSILGSQLI